MILSVNGSQCEWILSVNGFSVGYDEGRFETSQVERLAGHFEMLLEGMAEHLEGRLGELPMLSDTERRQLLVDWNETSASYPSELCVHELFEAQVELRADAVALVHEGHELSYGELNRRSNRLAHQLRDLGVGPDVLVGLCLERSSEMVVGMLGVLKAGGAYVPLDPEYPVRAAGIHAAGRRAPRCC